MKKLLIIFVLLPILILTISGCVSAWERRTMSETQLVALRSADSLTGSFVFASGSLDYSLLYIYYTKESDGGVIAHQVKASNVDCIRIYEEDRTDGVLRKTGLFPVDPKEKWRESYPQEVYYEFHVPKGTVIRQFLVE